MMIKFWTKYQYYRTIRKTFFCRTQNLLRNRNYNFYDVLGLDRNCTNDQIREAFIKLSKQYHPDVNQDNGAEEKFKSLQMAYEALNNDRNRDLYDAYMDSDPYSSNFLHEEDDEEEFDEILRQRRENYRKSAGQDNFEEPQNTKENKSHHNEEKNFNSEFFNSFENMFKSQRKTDKGLDIQLELNISLMESFVGSEKVVSLQRIEKCSKCFGYKSAPGQRPSKCFNCQGVGEVTLRFIRKKCNQCNGEGYIVKYPCVDCNGQGIKENKVEEVFNIPKGIKNGTMIRIDQKGHSPNNIKDINGDLLIRVNLLNTKSFIRNEDDIETFKEISLLQAICGDNNLVVESLDGVCSLNIPAGTQNNHKIIIKNKGMFKLENNKLRGNLIVTILIKIPNSNDYNEFNRDTLQKILKT